MPGSFHLEELVMNRAFPAGEVSLLHKTVNAIFKQLITYTAKHTTTISNTSLNGITSEADLDSCNVSLKKNMHT